MRTRAGIVAAVMTFSIVSAVPAHAVTSQERKAAKVLLDKINAKRASLFGDAALLRHDVMGTEAYNHSKYMKQQGTISHDGFCDNMSGTTCGAPDGNPTNSRVDRIWASDAGVGQICENVAYVSGYASPQAAARVLFRVWKNSPPHHDCMFDVGFDGDRVGVGVKKQGSTWYATFLKAADSSPGDH